MRRVEFTLIRKLNLRLAQLALKMHVFSACTNGVLQLRFIQTLRLQAQHLWFPVKVSDWASGRHRMGGRQEGQSMAWHIRYDLAFLRPDTETKNFETFFLNSTVTQSCNVWFLVSTLTYFWCTGLALLVTTHFVWISIPFLKLL